MLTYLSFSGPKSRLSHQSRQTLICVKSRKRGGYRTAGSDAPLNPNGWVIRSWTAPGNNLLVDHCLGNTVLSMCGGSGSLMEACMLTGRSCIMFESDGFFCLLVQFVLAKQYQGAVARMMSTFRLLKENEADLDR